MRRSRSMKTTRAGALVRMSAIITRPGRCCIETASRWTRSRRNSAARKICLVFLNAIGSIDMLMADCESDCMSGGVPKTMPKSSSRSRSQSKSRAVSMPPKYSASALLSETDFCAFENQWNRQPWYEQLLGLASQDGLRAGNITSKLGEQPVDGLLGFIFDSMFSDDAVKQITECEGGLRKLYGASPDPRKTQRAILRCLQKLVTDSPHAGALISQTPALLKALYDIDLLEADVVVEWHAQGGEKRPAKGAAVKVREAAEPFVNWLKEAKPMEL